MTKPMSSNREALTSLKRQASSTEWGGYHPSFPASLSACFCHQMAADDYGIILCGHLSEKNYHPTLG